MKWLLTAASFSLLVFSTQAQNPQLVNYQGMLTDSSGAPISGSVSMVFAIYDDSSGGNLIWSETIDDISVQEGKFSVLLGGSSPLGDSVFDEAELYLGIAVNDDPETQPRIRITSAPFANNASSVMNSSGGSILLVGTTGDSVQIDPYSGYAFRITNDSGD